MRAFNRVDVWYDSEEHGRLLGNILERAMHLASSSLPSWFLGLEEAQVGNANSCAYVAVQITSEIISTTMQTNLNV